MIRIDKLTKSVTKALEKKPYLELITVVLTIPVLITVIILNISNLLPKPGKATSTPTPEKQNQTVIHEREVTTVEKVITQPPAKNPEQCTKGIGPIEVSFPQEGDTSS